MINLRDLIDDAKCYQTVRDLRWPDGVSCPHRPSVSVIKDGKDDTQPHRQRYLGHGCRKRFDDLTDTIFAGHHQPLRTWIICLDSMGLNLSSLQLAQELGIDRSDAQEMVQRLRQGVVEMLQRTGEVVIRMLANVQRATIEPFIRGAIAVGSVVHTDESNIDNKLEEWGYDHHTVCHAECGYARDEDGDGFHEIHINTLQAIP